MESSELLARARALIPLCHCPYSRFRVTSVLEDSDGRLHCGVNLENGSYGLSICAERVALGSALASGAKVFTRMLIHSPDGNPMPCGACRQVLSEFCPPEFQILVAAPDGGIRPFLLNELLPFAFSLDRKEEGQ